MIFSHKICQFRDRGSNKGEEQSKPGLEALKNIEDRLTGNVVSGKKKNRGIKFWLISSC